MKKIILLAVITSILSGCNSRPTPENTGIKSYFLENKEIEKLYEVEKDITNGSLSQQFIYIADKANIEKVNNYMSEKYKGKFSEVFQVWYFNQKGIAEKYIASLTNNNASDKKFKELEKHLVATYEELKGQKGELVYNK